MYPLIFDLILTRHLLIHIFPAGVIRIQKFVTKVIKNLSLFLGNKKKSKNREKLHFLYIYRPLKTPPKLNPFKSIVPAVWSDLNILHLRCHLFRFRMVELKVKRILEHCKNILTAFKF